jgi:predicted transcriptional regulator of viral defense system
MMLDSPKTLSEYTARLQSAGKVSFARAEAMSALQLNETAFQKSAKRLQDKQQLVSPRNGFYVIVPPQYLSWGAPPPTWYIDQLMQHEGRPYYVGLLKAAELHGASHHAVMEFQIVTNKQLPKIRVGRSMLAFYYRKDFSSVSEALENYKTDAGTMKLSSPELTALDLLRYLHAVGGIDAIATVLSDLATRMNADKMASLARHFERTVIQRLGYLLEHLGHNALTGPLEEYLHKTFKLPWVTLEPKNRKQPIVEMEPLVRSERWHVVVYRDPEIDE